MRYEDVRAETVGRSRYGMLVPFPIACFVLTLLTDLAYVATYNVAWETFSVWLLTVGLIVAGIAVLVGIGDLVRARRVLLVGAPGWPAVLAQLVAFALALVNVFVHSRDGYTAVMPEGLALSAATVLVLAASLLVRRRIVRQRGFA